MWNSNHCYNISQKITGENCHRKHLKIPSSDFLVKRNDKNLELGFVVCISSIFLVFIFGIEQLILRSPRFSRIQRTPQIRPGPKFYLKIHIIQRISS